MTPRPDSGASRPATTPPGARPSKKPVRPTPRPATGGGKRPVGGVDRTSATDAAGAGAGGRPGISGVEAFPGDAAGSAKKAGGAQNQGGSKKPSGRKKPAVGKRPPVGQKPAVGRKPPVGKKPPMGQKPPAAPQQSGSAPTSAIGSPKPKPEPQAPVTQNDEESTHPASVTKPATAEKPAAKKKPLSAGKPAAAKRPNPAKKPAPAGEPAAEKSTNAQRPPTTAASASTDWRQPAALGRARVSTPPPRPTGGLPAPRTTPPITKPAYVATSKTARAAVAAPPLAAPFPAQKAPEPSTTQRVGAWVRERALLVSLAPLAVLVVLLAGGLVLSLSTARPVDPAVAPPAAEAPAAQEPAAPQPAAEAPAAEAPAGAALPDATMASVTTWVRDNLGTSATVLVDGDVAEQLFLAGVASARIVDASSPAAADADWRSIGYLVDTASLRAQLTPGVGAGQALDASVPVAAFDGAEIRAVAPQGSILAASDQQHAADVRLRVGQELLANPGVRMSDAERAVVASGRVDDRIVVILATMGSAADVQVSGFPLVDGETDGVIRTVAVRSLGGVSLVADGQPTADARALVDGFLGTYTPSLVAADGEDLILRYPVSIGTTIE
ncbi:hypothetical protein ABC304_12340 [Microbacterium sp. 1P10UB]|uniref:hypothetical protein n=1 Tax=unclassified Microbacterium TaxID=2609290 RepID=UPI0039A30017